MHRVYGRKGNKSSQKSNNCLYNPLEFTCSEKFQVINSGRMAVFGKKTGVLISSQLIFPSVLTHEMVKSIKLFKSQSYLMLKVHSFYIGHSYSDRKIKVSYNKDIIVDL